MVVKEDRMWIVETSQGIAYIGRNPAKDPKASAKAQKGKFWNWTSKNLGYPVVFKDKAKAIKFARRVRKSETAENVHVIEVEFYKGEMEAD